MSAAQVNFSGGWVVARTKPQRENYAAIQVERQGFEAYLPRMLDTHTKRVSPLFPGYLFVNTPGSWLWLRSTYGVLDVVFGTGGLPARLPVAAIDRIKRDADSDGLIQLTTQKFKCGQRVRLRDGAFVGWNALYADSPAPARERVLLQVLGAWTHVTVPQDWVEAA